MYLDILLFRKPLDVMLSEKEMTEYMSAPSDSTYFYSVIPVDTVLPTILNYEILDEAYIQRENGSRIATQLSKKFYDEVFKRTLELTGNLPIGRSSTVQM